MSVLGVAAAAAAAVAAAGAWWLRGREPLARVTGGLHRLRRSAHGWRHGSRDGSSAQDVDDVVLAQRVRSVLGRTTKALDLPHVRVSASGGVVVLEGRVGTRAEAEAIEKAAREVDGVDAVRCLLQVGLLPGVRRPSETADAPSPALRKLLAAAESAGVPTVPAYDAVRAVVATFFAYLPGDTREHVLAHLPHDVRAMAASPGRNRPGRRARRVEDFVGAVVASGDLRAATAGGATAAVLAALHDLVPEEAGHVAAVLPTELRRLWLTAV